MILDAEDTYTDFNLSGHNNDSFQRVYDTADNIINESFNTTRDQKDQMIGEDGEVEADEAWESMIKGGYSAIKLTGGSFALIYSVLYVTQDVLGFPPLFTTLALTVIVIAVVFGLIYMVFRFRG